MFKKANSLENKSDNFFQGDGGEEDVEDELKKMPDEFAILPDIKKSRGDNIDFVVVGPTGIFALEVKAPSHSAKVEFDGEHLMFNGKLWHKDPLSQAKRNATILGEYLKKEMNDPALVVNPVVVFSNYMEIHFGLHKLLGVTQVICKSFLIDLLTKKPSTLFSTQKIQDVAQKIEEFHKLNGGALNSPMLTSPTK
jgi:hypothetical protein